MKHKLRLASLVAVLGAVPFANAAGLTHVQFIVVDPTTNRPILGQILVTDGRGRTIKLETGSTGMVSLNTSTWKVEPAGKATTIKIPAGQILTLTQKENLPVKEITIRVTATRLKPKSAPTTGSTVRDNSDLKKYGGKGGGNDNTNLTKGQAGVAEDSAGQVHVRGEHGEIAYIVDGVPLPDTLSGRQGSIVVQSTIQSLEMITGAFAPEFGGQTAAILNISTLSDIKRKRADYSMSAGSYNSLSGQLTYTGDAGSKANIVLDVQSSKTDNAQESPQPDNQTSHNAGSSKSYFAKVRLVPNSKDGITLTLSNSPGSLQIANRSGLPQSFADSGQGFGLFGLRNLDGTRPDVNPVNAGALGAAPIKLTSQAASGQDINQSELSEFSTLNFTHKINKTDSAQFALTLLRSNQDVTNNNPQIDANNLPVDSSIEFNPTALRSVNHIQFSGNWEGKRGNHTVKIGVLYDTQKGSESYHIEPASQLALNALAAIAPNLAPQGTASSELDVNGNPIFTATGPVPTLNVERSGAYKASYIQDTYKFGKFSANYGLRADWYNQSQSLSQETVTEFELSPRLNFQYQLNRQTDLRLAYNRLFNTPPVAQGASVGSAIQPEKLNQYDIAVSKKLAPGRSVSISYYYKDIRNQVDTGLLIPGSQIGLYSSVNLERGGVHGLEFSYDVSAPKSGGWDSFIHYSLSAAKPNGVDNTGADVGDFNDHDQRDSLGIGAAYTWRSGASFAATINYGSGLASSPIAPNLDRNPRTQVDLHFTSRDTLFHGKGGIGIDVSNLFDDRIVINFQSAFSGTRFMRGRQLTLSFFGHF